MEGKEGMLLLPSFLSFQFGQMIERANLNQLLVRFLDLDTALLLPAHLIELFHI